jgi:hypothetical protein
VWKIGRAMGGGGKGKRGVACAESRETTIQHVAGAAGSGAFVVDEGESGVVIDQVGVVEGLEGSW